MQAGLLNTYRNSASNRSWIAWGLAALICAAYVLLYFGGNTRRGFATDPLQDLALASGLSSKWTLYGLVYTVAMILGGLYVLRRHGNSMYQRIRTLSVVSVQVLLAFATPLVLEAFDQRQYYLSYFWPLKIDYFYPTVILKQPFLIVAWSFLGSLVAVPILAYFLGKRFYCSWVCGCGGLANTAGEPFRHLSSKSRRAWAIEKVSIYSVLGLALVTTAIVWVNWGIGKQHATFAAFAFKVQRFYGFFIGALFSGLIGVAVYPLLGTRVWCRFGCPMAALLGLIQQVGRYRITAQGKMCIGCGNCSTYCEMGIDVRAYAMANTDVKRAACVGCGMCTHLCPRGVLKLETKAVSYAPGMPIRILAADL